MDGLRRWGRNLLRNRWSRLRGRGGLLRPRWGRRRGGGTFLERSGRNRGRRRRGSGSGSLGLLRALLLLALGSACLELRRPLGLRPLARGIALNALRIALNLALVALGRRGKWRGSGGAALEVEPSRLRGLGPGPTNQSGVEPVSEAV